MKRPTFPSSPSRFRFFLFLLPLFSRILLGLFLLILPAVPAFSEAFPTVCVPGFRVLLPSTEIRLAERLEIPLPEELLFAAPVSETADSTETAAPVLELRLEVRNEQCGWTILDPRSVYLTDGKQKLLPEPFCAMEKGNCGRIAPDEELVLRFRVPKELQNTKVPENSAKNTVREKSVWCLVLATGITSWETPAGPFFLEVWTGEKMRVQAETDACARICRVSEKGLSNVRNAILELSTGEKMESETAQFRFRFPLLPDGEKSFDARLTLELLDGTLRTQTVTFTAPPLPQCAPMEHGEILVGTCFYPAIPDETADTPEKKAVERALTSWDAPKVPNSRYCHEFVDDFLADPWGNLAVFWPQTPGPSADSPDVSEEYTRKLADAGIYSMSIYQHVPREKARRLAEAGKDRFFLQNNIGEYAGYLYQGIESARACGVPKARDLKEARAFFVDDYIRRGVHRYETSYPYIFSTSGSSLANYELEGGIHFICSELYAIGAQNLAWASSEMRAAARKWKPEYWGGWLAHEWQTGEIPYQTEQKFRLLRAGLLQQYLLGSSLMILESGSQTTQAGRYTADSGNRNFGYEEDPPRRYRKEMRRFLDFVRSAPKRKGTPETRIAAVLGNCDAYMGLYLPGMPVWAQHEKAEEDPRWRYGDAQKSSKLLQDLFFPLAPNALAPYTNRWLAGSPYGQTDVVGIDDLTRIEDLERYELLVYGGWNSMTPKIWELLQKYVRQGGTLILAVPHLSTRADCEGKEYSVQDLICGGDLEGLLNIRIVGKLQIDAPDFGPAPEYAAEIRFPEDKPDGERDEELNGKKKPEILQTVGGKPLWIRQTHGKGAVLLFLGWEYPGKDAFAPHYANRIRKEAERMKGEIFVDAAPEDRSCFSWAVYEDCVYVLNLHCLEARECTVHLKDRTVPVRLEPAEMRRIER